MSIASLTGRFHLGSHLCREPMPPMSELEHDMKVLKRHGFTLIKLQEHWDTDEPEEGRYDFSRYEELIEHAAKLDLAVYLGLTCEQAPRWLFEKHPGCRMVGANGYPVNYVASTTLPSDGKPGPCFDHPGALEAQRSFITALVATLGRYENLAVWNTWQEIGYWSEGLIGTKVCYCSNTIARFRDWLCGKYGDLDELNRRWNTRFARWESVYPDTMTTRANATPHAVEFAYYMENVQVAHVLEARAEAIRAADPLGRAVFAHKGGPEIASGVDWTYARCQDFLGTSAYPAWTSLDPWDDEHPKPGERFERHVTLRNEITSNLSMRFDHIRSCNPSGAPVWAAEFQGGPVSNGFYKGRVPSADDMRRWMLTTLASGVTTISFWVTRAEIMANETNGFSLLDSVGDTTERFEEAARIGAAVGRYPELFGEPNLEAPSVGIVVDEENYRFTGCLEQARRHLVYSTRGWHRMFWEAGVSIDFVDTRWIDDAIERYRLLVLPFPLSVSDEVFRKLSRFVDAGGFLVSEACPGRLTPYGFANRGELSPVAAELFGVRHRTHSIVREPEEGTRWVPPERTWGDRAEYAPLPGEGVLHDTTITPALYVEGFEPVDSEVILRHGELAAGTARRHGSGAAMLLGTLVGHEASAYRDQASGDLIGRLLDWTGVTTSAARLPGADGATSLLVRKRINSGREAWFFTNPGREVARAQVDVTGFRTVTDLLSGAVRRVGDQVDLEVVSLDVRVLILERA